jgi:hypothetical protein
MHKKSCHPDEQRSLLPALKETIEEIQVTQIGSQ